MNFDPGFLSGELATGRLKIFRKRLKHNFNTFSEAGSFLWTGFF